MSVLVGNDISHFQGQFDWSTYKNNTNFVIIQTSYGNGNFDSMYGYNKGQVLQTNLLRGYYHYAYPQFNAPEDEAKWFLSAINAVAPLEEEAILFLDYEESSYTGDPVVWVKTFLDYVSSHLNGYKMVLYTYQDMLKEHDFTVVAQAGYGLWIAAPTGSPDDNNFFTGPFPFAMMQQWGSQNNVPGIPGTVDADVFFGEVSAWKLYGYHKPQPVPPTQPPSTPPSQPPTTNPGVPPSTPPSTPPSGGNGNGTSPNQPNPPTPPVPPVGPQKPIGLFAFIQWLIKVLIG